MQRRFVVMTGLPASGKSQLAQQLAPVLDLPVIDKDEWLERALDAQGIGDASWRRQLSRHADDAFQRVAQAATGAILVSFWHQPGMPFDSGTPTDWLRHLCDDIVTIHCECPPDVAVDRFIHRQRHVGHLDHDRSPTTLLEQFHILASLAPVDVGRSITVATTQTIDVEALCQRITDGWARPHER